ncbi:hypothetical protein FSARC_11575 [Fusarium sarcochroum]|uniref:BRCT domain-containing protein n=1 Tax=Fusarium sarcochroum TaxID=1208366 RepID=A0A8H4TEL4_9HYPO|nr:hypothetical protein FSARC_11575 [Fusarium sarcochroum]
MPSQIFKNRVFAAAGPLPGQLTIDNLKRWSSLRKGFFLEDFDDSVTHLLCTREQFDKKVPRVREALKRSKGFHIVHCDWFEYSTVQNKRLPEAEYSMRNILAKQNAKKRERERIEKGKREAEKFVNTNLYHLYRDRENFVYQIDLTRDDELTGEMGQKYTLCLWESNAKPSLYWFTAKFLKRKGSSQPSYHRPSPHSGKWKLELGQFMDFFKKKTGIDWTDRVTLSHTMPSSYFQYSPPTGGKPVGRRLIFDIDYCREINAGLRGLPWPPVENLESKEEQAESDSDAGPRNFDDEDEAKASPPESDPVPEVEASAVSVQPDETEAHREEPEGKLEVPPENTELEPEGASTEIVSPVLSCASPAKLAIPSPSSDENGMAKSSEDTTTTSIEDSEATEPPMESGAPERSHMDKESTD